MRRLKVFSISHSAVVAEYRKRHAELAVEGDLDIHLLTPRRWYQFNRLCEAPPRSDDELFTLSRVQPRLSWIPHHGLRNAVHTYPGLDKLMASQRPDLLELWEEPFFAVSWQAVRVFRKLNPRGPIVFFSAQNVHKRRPWPFTSFERFIFPTASACITMNRAVSPVLRAKGWEGPCFELPLGIDLSLYDPAPPADPQVARLPSPVVCFIGKLTRQKGVHCFLEALLLLAGRGERDFSVLVVGSGEEEPRVRRGLRAIEERGRRTLLLQAVEHERIPAVLSAVELVVQPSISTPGLVEQFGRVSVEAMAAGKVVIVSDSGELPRVVGEAGEVFPEGDHEALAKLLSELLGDPRRRESLAGAAAARAAECFAWKVVARRQIEFYRRLGFFEALTRQD